MFSLTIEESFDSAHFLKEYKGKCSNIHGHRWKLIVEVASPGLIESGEKKDMIIDFKDLKTVVREEVADFDHSLIIERGSLREETLKCLLEDGFAITKVDFRPTAEMLAKYFYEKISKRIDLISRVTIYETPTNCASYG